MPTGFSSVIDVAFGPDGTMYVLEVAVDANGRIFVTTLTFGPPGGSVVSLNG